MARTMLSLARALIGVIGVGILVMTISNLAGGARFTDPVFPGGLVLGASCVGAAAWVDSPIRWRALVVWLGVAAVLVTLTILGIMTFATTDPSVYPVFIVPAAVVLAAIALIARERVRTGAFGAGAAGA